MSEMREIPGKAMSPWVSEAHRCDSLSRTTLEVFKTGLFPRQTFSEMKGKKGEGRQEAARQLLSSMTLRLPRWASAPAEVPTLPLLRKLSLALIAETLTAD